VHPRQALFVAGLVLGSFAARDAPAETPPKTPVSIDVVGHGTIRLVVSDGAERPCESSDNHILFNGRASAGARIDLTSVTGSVCVDHTYGAFRESQWAGASIWSGSGAGWTGTHSLRGVVSTDEP
jgi:hypothetical protein